MVLQNKHKRLASARWNKARGNPTKQHQARSTGPHPVDNVNEDSDEGLEPEEEEEEQDEFPALTSEVSSAAAPTPAPVSSEFSRLPLRSNADRYEEPEPDPYEEIEPTSEDEREAHNLSILTKHRLNLSTSPLPELRDDSTDPSIDHALKLKMQTRSGGKKVVRLGGSAIVSTFTLGVGRTVVGEDNWDQKTLEEMRREKEKADAISDVKARLLRADFGQFRPPSSSSSPKQSRTKPPPPSSGRKPVVQADEVDDFLNSL